MKFRRTIELVKNYPAFTSARFFYKNIFDRKFIDIISIKEYGFLNAFFDFFLIRT